MIQNRNSDFLAIITLTHGVLGSSVLLLPVLTLKTGYVFPILSIVFFGFVAGYTAYLLSIHSIGHDSIHDAIISHFSQDHRKKVGNIYNIMVILALLWSEVTYFALIVKQIEGVAGGQYLWCSFICFGFLLVLNVVGNAHSLGEIVMGYGLFTIISYLIFLAYTIASAPHGEKQMSGKGTGLIDMSVTLLMAFTCHQILVFVLVRTTRPDHYSKIVTWVFGLSILIYVLISLSAFGIVNRQPRVSDPQLISQYFGYRSWQVLCIEVIYGIHLLTLFPQTNFVIKKRAFELLSIEETAISSNVYIVLSLIFCFGIYAFKIKLSTLVELNGAITGLFDLILFPIFLHFKCVLYDKSYIIKGQEIQDELIQRNHAIQYRSQKAKIAELVSFGLIGIFSTSLSLISLFNTFFSAQTDSL